MKNNNLDMLDYSRMPPQATELEEAVLGAMLMNFKGCINANKLLIPEMFYKYKHQLIYKAITEVKGEVDMLTVTEKLKRDGNIELVGGAYYISQLTNKIASGYNSETHAKIIAEKYIKRLYIRYSHEISKISYEDNTDVFELQGMVNNLFQEIDKIVSSGGTMKHINTIVLKAAKELEGRIKNAREGKQTGIDTGLKGLNNMLCGWQDTDLIIQAARPAMGKTALALHHAYHAAIQGKSVCVYSLEMSDVRLVDRIILKISGLDADRYKSGYLSDDEFEQYQANISQLESLPIYIDDNPVVNMNYIQSNAMVMKQQGKCDLIIADYLQLVEMNKDKGKTREQEVSEASRKAKLIAKTVGVPFILLSQLSRAVETRGGDKRPNLSDLRDSGAIEQDADIVLFLYRPEYYGFKQDSDGNSTEGYGEIIVAKHRNGAIGKVPFKYNESMTYISDYYTEKPPF